MDFEWHHRRPYLVTAPLSRTMAAPPQWSDGPHIVWSCWVIGILPLDEFRICLWHFTHAMTIDWSIKCTTYKEPSRILTEYVADVLYFSSYEPVTRITNHKTETLTFCADFLICLNASWLFTAWKLLIRPPKAYIDPHGPVVRMHLFLSASKQHNLSFYLRYTLHYITPLNLITKDWIYDYKHFTGL
jgi:hypothetical protein